MMHPLFALGLPTNGMEWLFILMVVLILFGSKKLPELARGLGRSLHEFKKAREDFEGELHKAHQEVAVTPARDKQLAYPATSSLDQQVRELQEQLKEMQRQNQALQQRTVQQAVPSIPGAPAAIETPATVPPASVSPEPGALVGARSEQGLI